MKYSIQRNRWIVLLFGMFIFQNLPAQDNAAQTPASDRWHFLVEPYLMFPNMSGKCSAGNLPDAELDASISDIFSNLQMGAMLYAEAGNERWAISTDFLYMSLKKDVRSDKTNQSGDVNAKQFAWEMAGMHRLFSRVDAGIGFRYNSIDMGINLLVNTPGGGSTNKSKSRTESWVDPFIVARITSDPDNKFIYQIRGDIGGFGVGSNIAWQLQAYAGYRFSKLFQLTAGYRIISMDYEKGSGESRFKYDVDTYGPVLKLGFNF